jgi:sulfur carrier protein ThiS
MAFPPIKPSKNWTCCPLKLNMSAIIRPAGLLKQYIQDQTSVEVAQGFTIKETLNKLNIPSELVALVLVNGHSQEKNYQIADGDRIQLLAIVGGG